MREQQMKALERANVVRFAAADVKRELRDGRLLLGDALWDERAQSIVLRTLLMTRDRVGPMRVDLLLKRLEINGYKRVSALTERQKGVIADAA